MADPVICQADLQGTSSEEYFFFALISRSFLMVGPLAEMSSFALTFNRGKLGLIRLKERPWLCVAHAWVLVYTGQLEAMEPCLQNGRGCAA